MSDDRIHIRIPPDLKRRFEEKATRDGIPLSVVIRRLIEWYLKAKD